ncbi:hypothetical protein [Zavarzinella formosa]|uniref:hypothetical protein n=1 Tax=Zavarzinella formosa TaxID=360055 RepID=UPI00031801BB|nr:hypothetical protein [Zavarzinella formosa]
MTYLNPTTEELAAEDAAQTLDTFATILHNTLAFMLTQFKENGMKPSLADMLALEQVMEEALQNFDDHIDASNQADGFVLSKKLLRDTYEEVMEGRVA